MKTKDKENQSFLYREKKEERKSRSLGFLFKVGLSLQGSRAWLWFQLKTPNDSREKDKDSPLLLLFSLPPPARVLPLATPFPSLPRTSLFVLWALHQQPRRFENLIAVVGTWFIHRRRREKQGLLFQPTSSSSSSLSAVKKALSGTARCSPSALMSGRDGKEGGGSHPKHPTQVQYTYLFHEYRKLKPPKAHTASPCQTQTSDLMWEKCQPNS